jgi:muramoyltetrapeptide carboxypeptidase LdcA involved in peptidoglycan recycling
MNFGHTDPKIIIPLGCNFSFDLDKKEVVLLETPFTNI